MIQSSSLARFGAVALTLCTVGFLQAQPTSLTPKANWKLASRFSSDKLAPFTYSTSLTPGWINKTDTFWYRWKDSTGYKYWKVDPKARKKTPLFDSAKMASLLSELVKKPYDTTNLPIATLMFDEKNADLIRFDLDGNRYEYDAKAETLKSMGKTPAGPPAAEGPRRGGPPRPGGPGEPRDFKNMSPDKKAYVYAMDHNLYYVEVKDGKDQDPIQLTKDGEKDYSFGSREGRGQFQRQRNTQVDGEQKTTGQQARQENRVRAGVVWSKDSKRFYVTRYDSRKVKELWLVNNLAQPRPSLMTYKYEMPGEAEVGQTELFAFDPEKKELKKLDVNKYKDAQIRNIHWQDASSDKLRFGRRDRLQRNYEFCEMDLTTGKVTPLVTESVENAFLEINDARYLKPNEDFVWFSERTGWGHYYLYGNDGKLKNAITKGPFRASEFVELDADKGFLYFRGVGKEPNEDVNYRHLYRVKLDGSDLHLLDPGEADHTSTLSPSKQFIVDVHSRTDMAPKAVVRDLSGKVILDLEQADVSKLVEVGWRMPERFTVKAADGVTTIYGNMWKPLDFNPKMKYPIIATVYPGPQTEAVSSGFSVQATNFQMAQLGFIVIQIGNRGGNPARSNAYHSYGYYNLRDYGLADKKAGIEQLAAVNPWIDIDKVGIYGHSGGGFMTGAAMLVPPYNEFFKVGVSCAGNHDNNIYNSNWSEQHHGLKEVPVKDKDGKDTGETKFEIKVPTNPEMAANLKGKLLIVHGDMDNNVHPANSIRLVAALIKANKRFDFMLLPGQSHGFGDMNAYFVQMMLEYFSEHLLGENLRSGADLIPPK